MGRIKFDSNGNHKREICMCGKPVEENSNKVIAVTPDYEEKGKAMVWATCNHCHSTMILEIRDWKDGETPWEIPFKERT